jgi:alpha 1,2-mannosyltransferase
MQENGIKYGFVIALEELPSTIPTLWATTQNFMADHQSLIPADNLLDFVRGPNNTYNLCHFWSNFELGDLNFFRSKAYMRFFNFLDRCCYNIPSSSATSGKPGHLVAKISRI